MVVMLLTPQAEAEIARLVASGQYADASDVVDKAVHLLAERERKLQWLRNEIAIGAEQVRRGELIEFTPELFEEIKRQAAENARQGMPVKDAVKP